MRTKRPRRLVEKTCVECGVTFTTYGYNALRCPECAKKVAREQTKDNQKQWLQSRKAINKKVYRPPTTINEVVNAVDKYNKTHGTRLSYGQYVLMIGG